MTGAAPVPVPPPMPAVTKHHMRAGEMIADFVDRLLGRGAADFGLRAGAKALGHLQAHLNDALGTRRGERLRIGIGDDEVNAGQARNDHIVDGIAAGAADAAHHDAWLQFPQFGSFEIDGHNLGFSMHEMRSCVDLLSPGTVFRREGGPWLFGLSV